MPNSEFNRITWQEAPSVYVCACVVGGVWVGVLTRLLARLPFGTTSSDGHHCSPYLCAPPPPVCYFFKTIKKRSRANTTFLQSQPRCVSAKEDGIRWRSSCVCVCVFLFLLHIDNQKNLFYWQSEDILAGSHQLKRLKVRHGFKVGYRIGFSLCMYKGVCVCALLQINTKN